ncbi:hypothetical protein ACLMAL_15580 [Nocardia sp. CWNU-33]|uniref:hypothetical protein n=1 Tax=Nocardia sp. CWNU-33 TaxID=3392117 RepID=UPI00398F0C15
MERFDLISVDGIRLDAAVHQAASDPALGVLLVHGITVDKDEGGGMLGLLHG